MISTLKMLAAAVLVAVPLVGASAGEGKKDVVDTAAAAGDFKTLVTAIKAAGLVETLKGEGPFTVLAPTDAAFAALPEGTLDDLLKPENKDQLVSILTFHVLDDKYMASDLTGMEQRPTTVEGQTIKIDGTGETVMVKKAKVIKTDIEATNGVIHVIDKVLMPATSFKKSG